MHCGFLWCVLGVPGAPPPPEPPGRLRVSPRVPRCAGSPGRPEHSRGGSRGRLEEHRIVPQPAPEVSHVGDTFRGDAFWGDFSGIWNAPTGRLRAPDRPFAAPRSPFRLPGSNLRLPQRCRTLATPFGATSSASGGLPPARSVPQTGRSVAASGPERPESPPRGRPEGVAHRRRLFGRLPQRLEISHRPAPRPPGRRFGSPHREPKVAPKVSLISGTFRGNSVRAPDRLLAAPRSPFREPALNLRPPQRCRTFATPFGAAFSVFGGLPPAHSVRPTSCSVAASGPERPESRPQGRLPKDPDVQVGSGVRGPEGGGGGGLRSGVISERGCNKNNNVAVAMSFRPAVGVLANRGRSWRTERRPCRSSGTL